MVTAAYAAPAATRMGFFANFDAPTYEVDNFIVTNTGRAGSGGEGGVSFVSGGQSGVPGTLAAIRLTP